VKLSELREILSQPELRLTKALGQNFLHDANQLRRIVRLADLKPTEPVLEIGPGLGALTELLLESAGRVLAVEKDRRLADRLRAKWPAHPRFELHDADAVEWLRQSARDWSAWKLVANLPYSVASPILADLALAATGPRQIVVTVQWEVGQRLTAGPGSKAYGALTLLVQLAYQSAGCFRIPPSCFFPAPKVDSACLNLARRAVPWLGPPEVVLFRRVVRQAFSQRRKQMIKLLKADWLEADLVEAFREVGLPLGLRAEQVSLDQFAALTRLLSRLPSAAAHRGPETPDDE
jgi:16S rRNA (adenine1518-N6/adenine1519-N6)-dimethyltransferase